MLCSRAGAYFHGEILNLDGGYRLTFQNQSTSNTDAILLAKKNRAYALFFEFIRVPQVSKVRFSSAPWMVSLHPWWVVKLSFFTGSLQRFLPGGSPSDFPHVPVCSCSRVSCRSVMSIITKEEILSTKKVKKVLFFKKKFQIRNFNLLRGCLNKSL